MVLLEISEAQAERQGTQMICRKKPGGAFWATVGLVVTVLYVLSVGPAWWIVERVNSPILRRCYLCFYSPLGWTVDNGPQLINDAMLWYVRLWD